VQQWRLANMLVLGTPATIHGPVCHDAAWLISM
jgi:hypothetical protein